MGPESVGIAAVDGASDDSRDLLKSWGQTGRLALLLFDHCDLWLSYWPLILPLVTLVLALLLRNGFFWERLPNLRDSVRQLTDRRHPGLPEIYHDALQRLRARSEILRQGLERADGLLRRLYGPAPFGPLAFDRALSIAALYPICILFGVWLFSGAGTLGNALLLPPLSAPGRIGVVIAILVTIPCIRLLERVCARTSQMRTFEGVWTRSGYRAPEKSLSELIIQDIAASRHNSQADAATRGNRWRETVLAALALTGLVISFLLIDRAIVEFREWSLTTWDEKLGASVTYGNFLDTLVLSVSLVVTVVGVAEGRLAGMCTVPAICALTVTSALPAERHGRYTAVVMIIYAVCAALYGELINSRSGKVLFNISRVPLCIALVALLPLIAALLPHLSVLSAAPSNMWAADMPALHMVLFASLAPLYNAILDYLSVAITRTCISAYLRGSIGWVRFWALDLGSAIVLAVLACAGTLKILFLMRDLGWRVDASAIAAQFAHNPWRAQILWITLSAVTNLLPTLLHLVLLLWGLLTARFLRDGTIVDRLFETLKAGKALHPVDARVLVRYLLVDRYLALAFVLVSTICGIYAAVPWLLGILDVR